MRMTGALVVHEGVLSRWCLGFAEWRVGGPTRLRGSGVRGSRCAGGGRARRVPRWAGEPALMTIGTSRA